MGVESVDVKKASSNIKTVEVTAHGQVFEHGSYDDDGKKDTKVSMNRQVLSDAYGDYYGYDYSYEEDYPDADALGKVRFGVSVLGECANGGGSNVFTSFKVCGNYCGPDWANGQCQHESRTFPSTGTWNAGLLEPTDDCDKCCQQHDYCCYHRDKIESTVPNATRDCNTNLVNCVKACTPGRTYGSCSQCHADKMGDFFKDYPLKGDGDKCAPKVTNAVGVRNTFAVCAQDTSIVWTLVISNDLKKKVKITMPVQNSTQCQQIKARFDQEFAGGLRLDPKGGRNYKQLDSFIPNYHKCKYDFQDGDTAKAIGQLRLAWGGEFGNLNLNPFMIGKGFGKANPTCLKEWDGRGYRTSVDTMTEDTKNRTGNAGYSNKWGGCWINLN